MGDLSHREVVCGQAVETIYIHASITTTTCGCGSSDPLHHICGLSGALQGTAHKTSSLIQKLSVPELLH